MTAHADALIDAYAYGFALSEASLPINKPETVPEVAEQKMSQSPPPDDDYGEEFEPGLGVVLDGLARLVEPPTHT